MHYSKRLTTILALVEIVSSSTTAASSECHELYGYDWFLNNKCSYHVTVIILVGSLVLILLLIAIILYLALKKAHKTVLKTIGRFLVEHVQQPADVGVRFQPARCSTVTSSSMLPLFVQSGDIPTVSDYYRIPRRFSSEEFAPGEFQEIAKTILFGENRERMVSYKKLFGTLYKHKPIPISALQIGTCIGCGHFGRVHKGVYNPGPNKSDVAIKCLRLGVTSTSQFLKESIMMQNLNHPNVLPLIGVSFFLEWVPLIVVPYMQNGDLLSYLHVQRNCIAPKTFLRFACEIAEGMKHLHAHSCIHRDLAARNCMLDKNLQVKIADFGLSRDVKETGVYSMRTGYQALPIKWMAPESISNGQYSYKSDVWSYGIVLWELTTWGKSPYESLETKNNGMLTPTELLQHLNANNRLEKPFICGATAFEIMTQCWATKPEERPNFSELSVRIKKLTPMDILWPSQLSHSELDLRDVSSGGSEILSAVSLLSLQTDSGRWTNRLKFVQRLYKRGSIRQDSICESSA